MSGGKISCPPTAPLGHLPNILSEQEGSPASDLDFTLMARSGASSYKALGPIKHAKGAGSASEFYLH